MPDTHVHWTALPRAATDDHLEVAVFAGPRLGVGWTGAPLTLADFPEWESWPETLATRVTFTVELDGAAPVAAERFISVEDPLSKDRWESLLPATTPVTPWVFRDMADRPIHSFPVGPITDYLRDRYKELGKHSDLPPDGSLEGLREDIGGLLDTRVREERDVAQRDPTAPELPDPEPDKEPGGCLGLGWGWLRCICRCLRRLWRRLVSEVTGEPQAPQPGPAGVTPLAVPQWRSKVPPPAQKPAPFVKIDQDIAAHGVVQPQPAGQPRDTALDFAQLWRFYRREESLVPHSDQIDARDRPAKPAPPVWDVHRQLGAMGDYPRLLERLGIVTVLRIPRPASDPETVRVIPLWDGAARDTDICPRTRCNITADGRFLATPRPGSDLRDGAADMANAGEAASKSPYRLVQVDADGAALKAILAATSYERIRQLQEIDAMGLMWLWELVNPTPSDPPPPPNPSPSTMASTQSAGIAIVREGRALDLKSRLQEIRKLATPDPAGDPEELWADDLVRGFVVEVKEGSKIPRSVCERDGVYRILDGAQNVAEELELTDTGYVKRSAATSKDGDASPLYLHEAMARWTGWSLVAPRPGRTIAAQETEHGNPSQPTRLEIEEKQEVRPSTVPPGEQHVRIETRFKPVAGSLPRLRFGKTYRFRMPWVDLSGRAAAIGATPPTSKGIVYRRFDPVPTPVLVPRTAFLPGASLERVVVRSDFEKSPADWHAEFGAPRGWAADDVRHVFAPKTSHAMAETHGKLDGAFGPSGDPAATYTLSLRESKTLEDREETDDVLVTPYLPDPLAAACALRGVPGIDAGVSGDALDVVKLPGGERVLTIPFAGGWPDLETFRIRVVEGTAGEKPQWDAATRLLTVRLPKGRSATVTYSSVPADGALKLLGMWKWVDGGDANVEERAKSGAHWLVSPPRTLTLVHAVQRPVKAPDLDGVAVSRTNVGQTKALVSATHQIDAPSTGRLDLEATWQDYVDDPAKPDWEVVDRHAPVTDWTVERSWKDTGPLLAEHELGDTRHRKVAYALRATTSFREYLPEDWLPTATRDDLSRLGLSAAEVSVPATKRPDAPRVLYGVPAFGWDGDPRTAAAAAAGDTVTRKRVGGALRLFLARPWFSSGEGELLGVVVERPNTPLAVNSASRIGSDPIRFTSWPPPAAPRLRPEHFAGVESTEDVELADGKPATVVGLRPSFDLARRIWTCDVVLDLEALAMDSWPFLRLALVRYQPESIAQAKVSPIVLAEFHQPAPDRQVTVVRDSALQATVTMTGRAHREPAKPRLQVVVEQASAPDADELVWTPVDGVAGLPRREEYAAATEPVPGPDGMTWTTTVTLPAPLPPGALRLAIRELEIWEGDPVLNADRRPAPGGEVRIVHAENVPL